MKTLITYLLLFICASAQPAFAQNSPPASQQQTKEEPMPKAFTEWEQENVGREVAEENRYSELWNKTLLLLIVILLVLFVGTWYMKKIGGLKVKDGVKDARIQLLEKRVISPKAVVYLLSIDGQKIALSETSSGITVLQGLSTNKDEPKSLLP